MAYLTDRALASGVTLSDLLHIVIPSDVSQNPDGSSYKATIQQVGDALSGSSFNTYVFSGNADVATSTLTFLNNDGGTFTVTNSAALFSDNDINVTGGTYNPSNGCVTFTTNSGTTFDVCGFLTGFTDTNFANTDLTFDGNRAHDTNGFNYQLTSDGGLFAEGWQTLSQFDSSIGWGGQFIYTNSNDIRFYILNNETVRINNSGNVGIGTSTPTEKLHISGDTRHSGDIFMDNGEYIEWNDNTGIWPTSVDNKIRWRLNNDSAEIYALQSSSNDIDFVFKLADDSTTSTDNYVFWIDNNITAGGEANDRYPLEMNGSQFIVNALRRYATSPSNSGASRTNFYVLKSGATALSESILHANVITNRVGVNTSSPTETLDVSGKTKTINFQMTSGGTTGYVLSSIDNDGNAQWGNLSSLYTGNTLGDCITDLYTTNLYGCSPLHIEPSGVNDVYIVENGGNVGVGTTTPIKKLHISGDVLINNVSQTVLTISAGTFSDSIINFDNTGASTPFAQIRGNTFGGGTSGNLEFYTYPSGGPLIKGMTITDNGEVGIGTINNNDITEKLHVSGNTKISGSLNIGNILGNTPIGNLGFDSNGNVVTGSTTIDTDTFVTGGTYSAGTATFTNSSGGTFDVTGFTDTFVIAGTFNDTTNTLSLLRNDGNFVSITGVTDTFTGNTSGDCITDLFVSNIHSCSPLNINPLDEGNVYFGSTSGVTIDLTNNRVGINNDNPEYRLDISGTTGRLFYDGDTDRNQYRQSQIFNQGPSTGITAISIFSDGAENGLEMFSIGTGVTNSVFWRQFGQPGDVALYASGAANNLNIMNNFGLSSSGNSNNIRFYAGSTGVLSGNTSAMHIQGSGSTKGYIGINNENPQFTLDVAGETRLSGSGQNILTVIGSGDTQPLFTVQGSSGELFSVTDSLVGSLFSVNDISGLPILEVFDDDTIHMGNYQAPSLNTTVKLNPGTGLSDVYSIPVSAYTGAFFDYTVLNSTGARAGNIMSIFSGSTVEFSETTTNDIGSTSDVTFTMSNDGSNATLQVSATTTGWEVKTIVRSI